MEFRPPSDAELAELVPEGTFLLGYRGSVVHNLYEAPGSEFSTDDIDLMGAAIGPIEHYFGLKPFLGSRNVCERFIGQYDSVTYEVRKLVNLLCQANPNVLSLLWTPPEFYIKKTEIGAIFIENRNIFATKRAFNSFCGYAKGQLHRMTNNACQGYMGEKRKKLVEQFGYDTKNAAHAVRLMRMGIEFLVNGELQVYRTNDRDELLDIKHGKWSLDEIKSEVADLMDHAQDAYKGSFLPDEPDMYVVDRLLNCMISCELGFFQVADFY